MTGRNLRQAYTLIELIVIVLILGFLLAVVMPAILAARARARRDQCTNNMKHIGLKFHDYHNMYHKFPPSCHVERDPDSGKITAVDGWSWAVDLVQNTYFVGERENLDYPDGKPLIEPDNAPNGSTPHADALATVFDVLRCPSYSGSPYADPSKTAAITNYKVMGATHIESLNVASPNPTTPKYAPETGHPDGACFPGSKLSVRDFRNDGTAHTILLVETVEPKFSRWAVGAEATLVGLPPIVEYEMPDAFLYYAPAGFTPGKYDEQSTVDPSFRTYLDWDYQNRPYDRSDGSHHGKFGPGSGHSGIVNHTFVDGSVHAITNNVDVAFYHALITRDRGDIMGPRPD